MGGNLRIPGRHDLAILAELPLYGVHACLHRVGAASYQSRRVAEPAADTVTGVIRLAQAPDEADVVGCVRAAYTPHIARIGREPGPMSADYADLIARGLVYVLQPDAGATIVGVVVLRQEGQTLWIDNVAVRPEYQHHGLGRQMLAFAEEQARAADSLDVQLYANEVMTENIALYERFGYRETQRRAHRGFQRVFMRKEL